MAFRRSLLETHHVIHEYHNTAVIFTFYANTAARISKNLSAQDRAKISACVQSLSLCYHGLDIISLVFSIGQA